MTLIISGSYLEGTISAPPSKSHMQRACAMALLHEGRTVIQNAGYSDDDKSALRIIQSMGASVSADNGSVLVHSAAGGNWPTAVVDCGESGLAARLFSPIASLSANEITITGHGSLLKRSMAPLNDLLPPLGVRLIDFGGLLPYKCKGPLQPGDITVDGSMSSQFLSGLLMALAFAAKSKCSVWVKDLKSRPYVDLTLEVLATFGIHVRNDRYERFEIDPATFMKSADPVNVQIEGDWSSAAVWLAAAAVNGYVRITGLQKESRQADKALTDVLERAGAILQWHDDGIEVCAGKSLQSFDYDATHTPDLFPVMAVMAGACSGISSIKGLGRLIHKESNRKETIVSLLDSLGIAHRTEEQTLYVHGPANWKSVHADGCNDHRIVMAVTLAAIISGKEIHLSGAEAINKSYPDFFRDLAILGGSAIPI